MLRGGDFDKEDINIPCAAEPREDKHRRETKVVLEKQHFCEILPDPFHQGLPS